jgi:hypothetical protein
MSVLALTGSGLASVALAPFIVVLIGLLVTQEVLRARDEYSFWVRALNLAVFPLALVYGFVVLGRLVAIAS